MHRHGLRLTSDRFGSVTAQVSGRTELTEAVDVLLVTTKATHLDEGLERVPADVLGDALSSAGVDVAVRPDEAGLLWDKLCFLAPMALLTTATLSPLGQVRDRHATS